MSPVAIAVVVVLALFNARSWYWYARAHQIGVTASGVIGVVVAGTVVPPLQLVGLVRYRRNRYEYLIRRRNGVL